MCIRDRSCSPLFSREGTGVSLVALLLFVSCTAINQKDAFLDSLPRPNNVVFSEDFESGLGKWNQVNGTWTTGTPASNGLALISPTGTSGTTYNLTTLNDIDLSNRSNCELKYDASYNLSGTAGVWAQVLFAGSVVGEFKNTTGTAAISSSTQFITLKAIMPAGSTGKLTILISVPAGTADLRIDNLSISCARTFSGSVNSTLETFESGGANWTFGGGTPWSVLAGVGQASSAAAQVTCSANNTTSSASYIPTINLQGRSGCVLNYYYDLSGSTLGASNCLSVFWNGLRIRVHCGNGSLSAIVPHNLTAFEGIAANQLYFSCSNTTGNTTACVVDNITLTCQQ